MTASTLPVALQEWPLQEKDITGDLCKRCGLCCELTIGVDESDPRQVGFLRAVVENYTTIDFLGEGRISIRCSHLKQTKLSTEPHWECDIYETRPQLCRDFNCVSWAKVTNDRTLYNRVLGKMGLNSNKLMKDLELKGSTFSEELQGPDI